MTKTGKNYVPMPKVPVRLQPRYEAVMKVLAGQSTVAGAAESLGMSRNHFQTLLHRCMEAVLERLEPKPGGRPSKPEQVKELESEVERLRRENQRLAERVAMVDRLLGVASDLVTGKVQMRRPRTRTSPMAEAKPDDADARKDEPDGRKTALAEDAQMKSEGIPARLRALILGKGSSTLRRWRAKGTPPPLARALRVAPERRNQAEELIRRLNGRIGAEALRHAVAGISRRQAARLAAKVRTRLEVERKAAAQAVIVSQPGVIRGFDAMFFGDQSILVSADAAVPFRTSLHVSQRYDSAAVCAALRADFAKNGAPLVVRMDRAKQHRTAEVERLLDEHGVLVLHGPARHPQYYGQLERQNREHREWLEGTDSNEELRERLEKMRVALNDDLPRAKLGWRSAGEVWRARPALGLDRDRFRAEVRGREERIRKEQPEFEPTETSRLAIEQTLVKHGLLKVRSAESARSF